MIMFKHRVRALICVLGVGVLALGVYGATLAPGLTWANDGADGGELAAAAYTLGIAHSPGYPTFLLLAHLFTRLPIGEAATRTNLFSALCAAGTAALAAWSLLRMGVGWSSAAGAGLMLAFSPLLWSQATITEVHALNGFFTALLLALAVGSFGQRHAGRLAFVVGVVWGLSLGNQLTALFNAPLVGLLLWRRRRWWPGIAGILAGASVYLYLPLRALADPPLNWGDPQTWARFWWTISGVLYRPFVFALPRARIAGRLLAWSNLVARQFAWLGLFAAAGGAICWWQKRRGFFVAMALAAAFGSIWAIGYNTSDSYLYLIPGMVYLTLWFGAGVERWSAALAQRASWAAGALRVAVVVAPLLLAAWRFPAQDLSRERAAYAFRDAVLARAPANALVISRRDRHTFALWYFQIALGQRPDVVVIDLGLAGYDWYAGPLSRRLGAPVSALAFDCRDAQLAQILRRPVCRIDGDAPELDCVEPY